MKQKAPIFVIGNPRSGTTLLRLMLTCHRHICIPPEAGFALWLERSFGDWRVNDDRLPEFLTALFASRKFETWQLDHEALAADIVAHAPVDYAGLVNAVYAHYADQHNPGWHIWGDKNNYYLKHIPEIHRLFPEARFVHIVRDPRDVACSYRDLSQNGSNSDYRPRLTDNVSEIAEQWRANIERVEEDLATLDAGLAHRLRYEDLVSDASATLGSLCEFLGEEFDPAMLDYHAENRARSLVPEDFLAWKQLTLSPPQANRVGRYREDLEPEQAALIVSRAEPAFSRFYGC